MDLVLDALVMLIAFKLTEDSVLSLVNTVMNMTTYLMLRNLIRNLNLYLSSPLAEVDDNGRYGTRQNEYSKSHSAKTNWERSNSSRDIKGHFVQTTPPEEDNDRNIEAFKEKERKDFDAFDEGIPTPSNRLQKSPKTRLTAKNLASLNKARGPEDGCQAQ
jgi:hypothetical protein